jgi:hypothetical protein
MSSALRDNDDYHDAQREPAKPMTQEDVIYRDRQIVAIRIPNDCICTWGPTADGIWELRFTNKSCMGHFHYRHVQPQPQN